MVDEVNIDINEFLRKLSFNSKKSPKFWKFRTYILEEL